MYTKDKGSSPLSLVFYLSAFTAEPYLKLKAEKLEFQFERELF